MGKLFQIATEQNTLFSAWQHVRSNGIISKSPDTRSAIEIFDRNAVRSIRSIQSKLRAGTFEFDAQIGIKKKKGSGGYRGIVLASVHNRIVERALLDTLQHKVDFVRDINSQPTSVGGVPHRSVPHGLRIIRDGIRDKKTHFARSDISSFFDNIAREKVLCVLRKHINDKKFIKLLSDATTVTLTNEEQLGENRSIFPTDDQGVAQGSPLSPLFGNILLAEFDSYLNSTGATCVRFIDDFVILTENSQNTKSCFRAATEMLEKLGLECQNPYSGEYDPDKAGFGDVSDGIVFLGHHIIPGLIQPSPKARKSLLKLVDEHISFGKKAILEVKSAKDSYAGNQRYAQTQVALDRAIKGWGEAFSFGFSSSTFIDLDRKIDEKLNNFRSWFQLQIRNQDWKLKRRLGGVGLVSDISPKSLDELPFRVSTDGKYMRVSKAVTVSTDGSVHLTRKAKSHKKGPGGWAFVTHDGDKNGSGHELETTNNQMELTGVIEALEFYKNVDIVIRTDSNYVTKIANGEQQARLNLELWQKYKLLTTGRKVKVVWVKGHAGDPHNEAADKIANEQMQIARKKLVEQKLV